MIINKINLLLVLAFYLAKRDQEGSFPKNGLAPAFFTIRNPSLYAMHALYKSSHTGQKGVTVSFTMLNESGQEDARRTLNATPYHRAYLLVANNSPTSLHPTVASANEPAANPLHSASARDELLPTAELSARTYNALLKGRITTIKQLCGLELGDLKWLRNFGKKAVCEVIAYRARLGVPMKSQV